MNFKGFLIVGLGVLLIMVAVKGTYKQVGQALTAKKGA